MDEERFPFVTNMATEWQPAQLAHQRDPCSNPGYARIFPGSIGCLSLPSFDGYLTLVRESKGGFA